MFSARRLTKTQIESKLERKFSFRYFSMGTTKKQIFIDSLFIADKTLSAVLPVCVVAVGVDSSKFHLIGCFASLCSLAGSSCY